jgi:hypothetical protein
VSILSFEEVGSSEKNQLIGNVLSLMVIADIVAIDGVTIIDCSDVEGILMEKGNS